MAELKIDELFQTTKCANADQSVNEILKIILEDLQKKIKKQSEKVVTLNEITDLELRISEHEQYSSQRLQYLLNMRNGTLIASGKVNVSSS